MEKGDEVAKMHLVRLKNYINRRINFHHAPYDSLFKTQTTEGQYVSATSVIKWVMSWNYQPSRTITSRGRKVREGGVPKDTETISVSTYHYLALKRACIYVHTHTHSCYSFLPHL